MVSKKLILNAENFGTSQEANQAILEGYMNGFLQSASLTANGSAYDNAIHDILPDCPDLSVGVHLNILSGKALTSCQILTDYDGYFNRSFFALLQNHTNLDVLSAIEQEFRAQIEKVKESAQITHIDSNPVIHLIPEFFDITCKLAKEYNIPFVRTNFEEFYFVPRLEKHFSLTYFANLFKLFFLQHYTKENRTIVDNYQLKTNDFNLGLLYAGMMDSEVVEAGAKVLDEDCIVEVTINPKKYSNSTKDNFTREFGITQNMRLKDAINRLGFDITNYKNL